MEFLFECSTRCIRVSCSLGRYRGIHLKRNSTSPRGLFSIYHILIFIPDHNIPEIKETWKQIWFEKCKLKKKKKKKKKKNLIKN